MSFDAVDPLAALSALVYLAIAIVAVRRVSDVPLARPLALFAICLFAYVIVEQGSPSNQRTLADAFENALGSLAFIPAVELVLGFAGQRRAYRWVRYAAFAFYIPLALFCFTPFYEQQIWELGMFGGLLFFFGVPGLVLVRHYRQSGAVERGRTLLLLGGLLLGGLGAATTLLVDFGAPRLLELGIVLSGLLLALLVLDRSLLRGTTRMAALTAGVFATLVVGGEVLLFSLEDRSVAVFVAGTLTLVLVAFVAVRPVFAASAKERARAEEFATLGRLSTQMAHDLKNPLAAVSSAAQFLLEERRQGRTLDESVDAVQDILEDAQRIQRVVENYQRLSRVEPELRTVDVAVLLTDVAEAQAKVHGDTAAITSTVEGEVGEVEVDPDLLRVTLENVVLNACQAIAEQRRRGKVTMKLYRRGTRVHFEISDDGPGMSPRVLEQALGWFFTTKAQGTGLGLSYASRVAEVHGGEMRVESIEEKGTVITIVLPA